MALESRGARVAQRSLSLRRSSGGCQSRATRGAGCRSGPSTRTRLAPPARAWDLTCRVDGARGTLYDLDNLTYRNIPEHGYLATGTTASWGLPEQATGTRDAAASPEHGETPCDHRGRARRRRRALHDGRAVPTGRGDCGFPAPSFGRRRATGFARGIFGSGRRSRDI